MKELKLVKEKTPTDQIKASEIDLHRHIVIQKGSVNYYILHKSIDGHLFINPTTGEIWLSQREDQSLEDFLGKTGIRIFEL